LFTGRDGVSTAPLVTAEPGTATSTSTATLTWYPDEDPSADDEAARTEPPVDEAEAPEPDTGGESEESAAETDDHASGDHLASTGTWLSGLLVVAGALVVSGLLILVLGRKRRGWVGGRRELGDHSTPVKCGLVLYSLISH